MWGPLERVTTGVVIHRMTLGLTLRPLQEQQVFITSVPSLQLLRFSDVRLGFLIFFLGLGCEVFQLFITHIFVLDHFTVIRSSCCLQMATILKQEENESHTQPARARSSLQWTLKVSFLLGTLPEDGVVLSAHPWQWRLQTPVTAAAEVHQREMLTGNEFARASIQGQAIMFSKIAILQTKDF